MLRNAFKIHKFAHKRHERNTAQCLSSLQNKCVCQQFTLNSEHFRMPGNLGKINGFNSVCFVFCFCRMDPDVSSWSGMESSLAKHPVVWLLCILHCARLAPFFLLLVARFLKELNLDWVGLVLLRLWLCLHYPKSQIVAFRIPIFCYA